MLFTELVNNFCSIVGRPVAARQSYTEENSLKGRNESKLESGFVISQPLKEKSNHMYIDYYSETVKRVTMKALQEVLVGRL